MARQNIETTDTLNEGRQKINANETELYADFDTHEARTDNPHSVTKTQVGLGNVDNTSDANKPVSTAQQAALDLKASLDDVNLTTSVTISGTTTLDSTAFNKIHLLQGTSANYTVTLPTAVGNSGKMIGFKGDADLTLFDKEVTIDGLNLEKIDTRASYILSTGGYLFLYVRNNNYDIIAFDQGALLSWTATFPAGFSVAPSNNMRYKWGIGIANLMCAAVTNGTSSGATSTYTITLPAGMTAKYNQQWLLSGLTNGGSPQTAAAGSIHAFANSNTLSLFTAIGTGTWNTGGKNASFSIWLFTN